MEFKLAQLSSLCGRCEFKNIVFCAPPSGFDDYPSAIQNVIDTLWVGGGVKEEEGNCDDSCAFIFTSSGGM